MSTISTPPTTPSASTNEPEKKKSEPRPYVVLRKTPTTGGSPSRAEQTWEFVRNVEATSTEQAIRKTAEILVAASEDSSFNGTLVAVAARSFVPVRVSVETKTQLKLG